MHFHHTYTFKILSLKPFFLSGILMELLSSILAIQYSNIWMQQRHVETHICKLFQDLQKRQQAQPINAHLLDKKRWNAYRVVLSQNLITEVGTTIIFAWWVLKYLKTYGLKTVQAIVFHTAPFKCDCSVFSNGEISYNSRSKMFW